MASAPYVNHSAETLGSLAMLGVALATGAIAWRLWPFFRTLVVGDDATAASAAGDGRGRRDALDGLRGVLCLLVFIHHAQITLHLDSPRAPWDDRVNLAPAAILPRGVSVGIFFGMTAFLFYRRVLDRPNARPEVGSFFVRRVARLAPMVLVSGALMFAADLLGPRMLTGDDMRRLFLKVVSLTTYGHSNYAQNSAVYWTLAIEWMFYLAFPLIAAAVAGGLPRWAVLLGVFGVTCLISNGFGHASITTTYLSGMLAAEACEWPAVRRFARAGRGVCGSLAILAIAWLLQGATPYVPDDRPYYFGVALSVFAILTLVASGTTFFGLLRLPALRAIGTVSYSVYLLHGIVLFALRPVLVGSPHGTPETRAILCGVTLFVVLIAFVCYRWIEHPAIALGHRVTSSRRRNAPAAPVAAPAPAATPAAAAGQGPDDPSGGARPAFLTVNS